MRRVVAEHGVERAIIARPSDAEEEILDAIRPDQGARDQGQCLPPHLEVVASSSTVDEVDGLWLLGVRQSGLARSSKLLNRGLDIVVTGLGLAILGPLFLMIKAAVKLDSPGNVFSSRGGSAACYAGARWTSCRS